MGTTSFKKYLPYKTPGTPPTVHTSLFFPGREETPVPRTYKKFDNLSAVWIKFIKK